MPTTRNIFRDSIWLNTYFRDGPKCPYMGVSFSSSSFRFPHLVWRMHSSALVFLSLRLSGILIVMWGSFNYNLLQIIMAALVFTVPFILLLKPASLSIFYLFLASYHFLLLLFRMFAIVRSLEERIPLSGRVKSASEIEITRIESGV